MFNFLHILKYIYYNRYRRLTYGDSNSFWIFFVLYFIIVYRAIVSDSDLIKYILLLFFVEQCAFILERNDFLFLKKQLGLLKAYLLIVFDLFIISLPLIFVFYKSIYLCIILSLVVVSPCLLLLKKNNIKITSIFSSIDPLWIINIRKKNWKIIFLILVYYINYEAIANLNVGLFFISCLGMNLIISNIYSESEKLIYLKFSKLKKSTYLFNLMRVNIINTFYLFLPSFFIVLLFTDQNTSSYLLSILKSILVSMPLLCFRYLFFHNKIIKEISSCFVLIILFFISSDNFFPEYIIYIILITASYILFKITAKKIDELIYRFKA